MLRNIKKRVIMLGNRMPFAPEKQAFFTDMEKLDWIYHNMCLEGSLLTKGQIEDALEGDLLQTMRIDEPIMIERLSVLFDRMYINAEKSIALDLNSIRYMNHVLSGKEIDCSYRKTSVIVHQWDYSAIHPADIPKKIRQLEQLLEEARDIVPMTEECFEYAEKIHNSIIEILPYGEHDGLLARVACTYYLMEKGYPAATPKMKEQDYNNQITVALKTGELQGFKELLKKEISDRLDLMIQLTAY